MGVLSILLLALTHPTDVRNMIQYKVWHEPARDITSPGEFDTSGFDRKSMRRCWEFLDMTSRSFSAVIKELDGDLARVICLFYLTLRGLDTVEDDMTIPDEIKQPLLRVFHEKIVTPGWSFGGNGPQEKDRQLLVEFNVVVEELAKIPPSTLNVIIDITKKMENGMADFAHKAILSPSGCYIDTIEEFDLYCHYVAGLVGEGLSRLFVATDKEGAFLADQLVLSNSMGLLLQKTNILRDIREDIDDGRYFWPRSIWEKHGFTHPSELRDLAKRDQALWVLSAMTLDALRHAEDALDYLALLKNQSVFNFVAIPAAMALATLSLCFMNTAVFDRNIKIRKGQAVSLIMKSTNPRDVSYMFRNYARQLHAKAVPSDPYYIKISIACAKIEQWCEHHYPSFVVLRTQSGTQSSVNQGVTSDARLRIVSRQQELVKRKQAANRVVEAPRPEVVNGQVQSSPMPWELFAFMGIAFTAVCLFSGGIVWVILKYVVDDENPGFPPVKSDL